MDSPAEGPGAKFFDLISFDPRGIRLSTPRVSCFNDTTKFNLWSERLREEGVVTSSDAALGRLWSMSHAVGSSCERVGDDDIKHFVSTASVATDMVRLTEAHGSWREQEAKRLLWKGCGRHNTVDVPSALAYTPGNEMIQYWGFSYGTLLGATFAGMYPDRIHRLVLDGVVDAVDYTANLWYDNLEDTDKAIDLFYHHCARVGQTGCPLADENSTAQDIEKKVAEILQTLYHNPLPRLGPNPDVVLYSDVRMAVLTSLYSPLLQFPILAKSLADIEKGQKIGYLSATEETPQIAQIR